MSKTDREEVLRRTSRLLAEMDRVIAAPALQDRVDRTIESCAPALGYRFWAQLMLTYRDEVAQGATPDPVWDELFDRRPSQWCEGTCEVEGPERTVNDNAVCIDALELTTSDTFAATDFARFYDPLMREGWEYIWPDRRELDPGADMMNLRCWIWMNHPGYPEVTYDQALDDFDYARRCRGFGSSGGSSGERVGAGKPVNAWAELFDAAEAEYWKRLGPPT